MTINLVMRTRLTMVGVSACDLRRIRAKKIMKPTTFPIPIFSLV
jgi:hypothetical protein